MQRSIVIALLILLSVAFIPTIAGYLLAPEGWQWTGLASRDTEDLNGYLSIIEEIRQDGLRARNLFTAEPQPQFQIRPCFAALAMVGKALPSVSSLTLLEGGRVFFSIILLMLISFLACRVFQDKRERLIAFLFMAAGSGLGWTHIVHDPSDLRIVETSTFLALLSPPLYPVSLSLVIGIFLLLDRAWTEKKINRFAFFAGILALWLGFDRPFSLAPLSAGIGGTLTWQWLKSKRFPATALIQTIPVATGAILSLSYQFFTVRNIAAYAQWNRQHILLTPTVLQLLVSFGLLLPLAILGLRRLNRSAPILAALCCSYAIGSLVLSHLPISFQERFLEGLPICLALPASCAFNSFHVRLKNPLLRTAVTTLALVLVGASNFQALSSDLVATSKQSPPQHLPTTFLQGIRQLTQLAKPDEPVLSSLATGNFIPAYSARPVVIGHKIATAFFNRKYAAVMELFQSPVESLRTEQLINNLRARWLLWGPEETVLSRGGFNPAGAPFLQKRYQNQLVTIYEVRPLADPKRSP